MSTTFKSPACCALVYLTVTDSGEFCGTPPLLWMKEIGGGGDEVTVKLRPLLAVPPTVTTTLPVVAPEGTGAVMLVALQAVGVAVVPLKRTVLVPWVAPKFVPAIVIGVPTLP